MKLHEEHNEAQTRNQTEDASWRPEVLEGALAAEELPADFDLDEVWYWFHSRLRALGNLSHDDARLTAVLNWNEIMVGDALRTARLSLDQQEEGAERQAHLEYLTAEFLTRHVLQEESIPSPKLKPA